MQGIDIRVNQSVEEARIVASFALAANRHLLGRFVSRAAYVGVEGSARNILTVFIGDPPKDDSPVRPRQGYHRGLVLDESVVEMEVIEAAIRSGLAGLPVVGFTCPDEPKFTSVRWPSANGLSPWPGTLIWHAPGNAGDIPHAHGPVTGPGEHAYYPDMYAAAASWCGLPGFHGGSDGRVGGFVLFVPELRGRIGDIELNVNTADVEIVLNTKHADQWRLKGGYYQGGEWVPINEQVSLPTTRVRHAGSYYALALVDESGNIVDHWHPSSTEKTLRRVTRRAAQVPELVEHVSQCLDRGECDTVEFKPAVQPSPGVPKFQEIVRTVVAFANTRGGTILIGVSDLAEIQDVLEADEFKRWRGNKFVGEDGTALLKYGATVVDKIRCELENLPDIKVASVQYQGANLIILTVQQGTAPPYFTKQRHVFVRRGATNRFAHPEHDRLLFTRST